ncbi:hypothetical protein [Pseudomonas sp. NPDC007930]|uniref:hypothetical protein n=1 Tax=Pseudomonas sp. NPDC007930 TaxID=3364417 RepID=UPI0036E4740A
MFKRILGCSVLLMSSLVDAQIIDVSGDMRIGPKETGMRGWACKSPDVFFRIFDAALNDKLDDKTSAAFDKELEAEAKRGNCFNIPLSTAVAMYLRMAKISVPGKEPQVVYTFKVSANGHIGYTPTYQLYDQGRSLFQD